LLPLYVLLLLLLLLQQTLLQYLVLLLLLLLVLLVLQTVTVEMIAPRGGVFFFCPMTKHKRKEDRKMKREAC